MPGHKSKSIREELEETLDESEWRWLADHLARDAVILVSQELDLLAVGEKVAGDDRGQVAQWIERKLLTKPDRVQIETWTRTPEKKFLTLIVQPYVLVQERLLH